ncbi:Biotin synthase [Zea mays]|uniref:Biotin synthase n=1 Tax=Zea mays TaxID=4577 RepID=A0A1D6M1W1_MAIZE|nr:Biotin synthase [Zea mays]
MTIANNKVGLIIGKGGKTIKSIQAKSGARIQVVEIWGMICMVVTARIVMPRAMVRLSTGRILFSMPEQAVSFLGGANSIFVNEKLLTTVNNNFDMDHAMFTFRSPIYAYAIY